MSTNKNKKKGNIKKKLETSECLVGESSCTQMKPVAYSPTLADLSTTVSKTLTGIPRKTRDCCVDLYNYIQQWKGLVIDGSLVINSICELKLQSLNDYKAGQHESAQCGEDALYPAGLAPLWTQLEAVTNSLERLVEKMESRVDQLSSLAQLDLCQSQSMTERSVSRGDVSTSRSMNVSTSPSMKDQATSPGDSTCDISSVLEECSDQPSRLPVFNTWTSQHFALVSSSLVRLYRSEIQLKRSIVQHVSHAADRSAVMFYYSTWTVQAFIPLDETLTLHALTLECGL